MKNTILISAIFSVAMIATVNAQDFSAGMTGGMGGGAMVSSYDDSYRAVAETRLSAAVEQLGLDEEQAKKMKKILMSEEQGLANIKSAFGLTSSFDMSMMSGDMMAMGAAMGGDMMAMGGGMGGDMMSMGGGMGMGGMMSFSSASYDYKEVARMLEKHSSQHDKKYKKVLSAEQYDQWVKTENKIYSDLLAAL